MTLNEYGMDETFISCSCGSEVLRILYEPIIIDGQRMDDNELKDLDIAIFSLPGNKWTWWNRIRCIWYIIKDGRPFNDQIQLEYSQVKMLRDKLNEFLGEK